MNRTVTSIGCCMGLGGDDRELGPQVGELDDMLAISAADQDVLTLVVGEDDTSQDPGGLVSDFEPSFTPTTAPAEQIPDTPAQGGALTPKAAGWARGDGTYVVQSGDTLSGLAMIYLGNGARYPEIWNLQSADYHTKRGSPNNIVVGDVLQMPAEAQAKAKALGVFSPATPAAAATVAKASAPAPTSHKLAIGVGALAAGFGLMMFFPGKRHGAKLPHARHAQKRRHR